MHLSLRTLEHDMNSSFSVLESKTSCMFASNSILRRQHFLIRSLRGYKSQNFTGIMAERKYSVDEVVAGKILRKITPDLEPGRYKGQAGKIAVIGGCREYTGAPYFAAISALKIGADLSHVFCTKDAATVIKSYSPELIVHPVLEESYNTRDDEKELTSKKVLAEVAKWMTRFDCLVVGPGLGRDPFLMECVSEIIAAARHSKIPIVVDGDGLFLVTDNLELIRGYPLAVLTPNVNEYKRLVEKVFGGEVNCKDGLDQLQLLAQRIGVTILQKGNSDIITDGRSGEQSSFGFTVVNIFGSPRRCGGQGDILSGSVAVFSSWARRVLETRKEPDDSIPMNPMVLGSISGSVLLRKAASLAFGKKKRSTLTTDIIEFLGESLEHLCPAF
ncbi:unnamed protein product [Victoria cruziana]